MPVSLPEFLKHQLDQFHVCLGVLIFLAFHGILDPMKFKSEPPALPVKPLRQRHNLDPRMQLFDIFTSLPHWWNPLKPYGGAEMRCERDWFKKKNTAKIETQAPTCNFGRFHRSQALAESGKRSVSPQNSWGDRGGCTCASFWEKWSPKLLEENQMAMGQTQIVHTNGNRQVVEIWNFEIPICVAIQCSPATQLLCIQRQLRTSAPVEVRRSKGPKLSMQREQNWHLQNWENQERWTLKIPRMASQHPSPISYLIFPVESQGNWGHAPDPLLSSSSSETRTRLLRWGSHSWPPATGCPSRNDHREVEQFGAI